MASTRHAPHLLRTWLLALVLTLVAASCSSGGGGSEAADPGSSSTTTTDGADPADPDDPGGPGGPAIEVGVRIEVLSSQPDRVSGPEARVRVTPGPDGTVADLVVTRGDEVVTDQLTEVDGALEGIVSGFIEGNNVLEAADGSSSTEQRIRAWPLTGPVLSGPQLPLLACATEANGLGPATTANDCSAPTTVTWSYVSEAGALTPLPDPGEAPADLATATIAGEEVPLYVRIEKGTINRSIYEIASIDATPGDDDPTGPGWNGRLLYRFGGLCGTTFGQGSPATSAAAPTYLQLGYAVATASFNNASVQCNDVLSAETTMMVKERFIETFGVPDHTIGEGASGGAAQIHLILQNYPELLDGAAVTSPFPDVFSVLPGITDCALLERYYASAAGFGFSPEQRAAINGHATARTCTTWGAVAGGILDPTDGCDPDGDRGAIYSPTNTAGIRCDIFSANINSLGIDPQSGQAYRPLDNVGVQYGLEAFNAGLITADQFLDLNEAIGGFDADGQPTDERHATTPDIALDTYSRGRIASGGGDLLSAPIIDVTVYNDPLGDVHDAFRGPSLRTRFEQTFGPDEATGFQLWTRDPGATSLEQALAAVGRGSFGPEAVAAVDAWLSALADDGEGGSRAAALARTRPDDAADNCRPRGGEPITGDGIFAEDGACTKAFPWAGDPRIAAGGPFASDVIKCQLKAPDLADYDQELTNEQYDRLFEVFVDGVCDWSGIGVGQTLPAAPGRDYGDADTPATRV